MIYCTAARYVVDQTLRCTRESGCVRLCVTTHCNLNMKTLSCLYIAHFAIRDNDNLFYKISKTEAGGGPETKYFIGVALKPAMHLLFVTAATPAWSQLY